MLHPAFDPEILIYFESVTAASSGTNVFAVLCCAGLGLNQNAVAQENGNAREMGRMEPSWAQMNIFPFLGALIPFQKGCSWSRPRFSIAFECRVFQSQYWFVGDKCHRGEWTSFLPSGPSRKAFIPQGFIYIYLYTFKLCLLCVFSISSLLLVSISLLKISLLCRIPSEGCTWMLSCSSLVFNICKCSYIFNKNSATARWCTWQLSL